MNITEKQKRKYCSSVTHTTGDIQKNIDHVNKMLVGKAENNHTDGYLNGTFKSQSPDGASSISTSTGSEGGGMGESLELKEAKRYVRRYYVRPQNIFCSSKTDILKVLVDCVNNNENCSVYTLNNLVDNDDITKLSNNDIIYYFDDNVLYDKNRVPVMDYDLYVKHEEKRDKIDADKVSDAKFSDVYDDRITDQTVEEESFNLNFDDVNAYGKRLVEGKEVDGVCCICGEPIDGYGNNPEPYVSAENGERCCDACNLHFVIPARIEQMRAERNK